MRRLSWIVLALAWLAQPADAGPLAGAIAAISGFIGSLGPIGSAVLRIVIGKVLSRLGRSRSRKEQKRGIKAQFTGYGEDLPQTFLLGQVGTPGYWVAPWMSHGADNRFLNYVIDLGDLPITALTKVFVNGEEVVFAGTAHPDYGTPATGQGMWLKFYDGTQTAADPMLLDKYGSDPERPWLSDMVLTGVPYAILTFKFNPSRFNGRPEVRFEAQGIPLYDPRKDSTVGGSGSHRWNDPSTWEFTENNIVMAYNIARNIAFPDGTVWGLGAEAEDLPLANWFAGMNACDAQVAIEGGGTEAAYRASMEVSVDREPYDVIDELLKACGGEWLEFGGYFHVAVGAPSSSVLFITDDDVIVTSPRVFEPFPGHSETYNAVSAVYRSAENAWEPTDAEVLTNPSWETEDGGERLIAQIELEAVGYDRQVRRLMRELAGDNRRFRGHALPLPPEALSILPLETLSWTSDFNGYSGKLFEITKKIIDPRTLESGFVIRERDPSDYDPDPADDAIVPTPPSRVVVDPLITGVEGWAVSAVAIEDDTRTCRRAAIQIGWDTEIDAEGISWEIRVQATAANVARGTISDLSAGALIVADGILPNTQYEVRGQAVSNRSVVWGAWTSVPTSSLLLGPGDLVLGSGVNLLGNADFRQGVVEMIPLGPAGPLAETTLSIRAAGQTWAGATYPTARLTQNGTTAGYVDLRFVPWNADGTYGYGYPVTAGETYEMSAQISTHRCTVENVRIQWLDDTGAHISYSPVSASLGPNPQSSSNPETWIRLVSRDVAPAGAAFARPFLRKAETESQTTSDVYIHKPMFGLTHAGATAPLPWSPSTGPVLSGLNIVANSVTANQMSANSITAANGAIADLTVTTLKIGGLAVTTEKIANNAVTNGAVDSTFWNTVYNDNTSPNPNRSLSLAGCTAGSKIVIWVKASNQWGGTSGSVAVTLRLGHDGVTVHDEATSTNANSGEGYLEGVFSVTANAGTNTFKVTWIDPADYVQNNTARWYYMAAIELKK